MLGVSGAGGLPPSGRRIADDDLPGAAEAIDPQLPRPVDHVLLQADLTAVAPGPLETEVARRLHLLADVESRGGATVYRFSSGSLRRGFDAGWSALEVRDFLTGVSQTPVPQPLEFLVDDVARTFGSVRVGHAEAFLRADDEAALAALVHDPKARTLGLRLLAPTVAISTSPLDVLLPRLRELGAAPVVEAADGTVRVSRPDLQRARSRRGRRPAGAVEARRAAQVQAVATAIRAGDRAETSRPASATTTTPSGRPGRPPRRDRGRRHRGHRLRRQPRRHGRAGRRPAPARRRPALGVRPPRGRRTRVRGAPHHRRPPHSARREPPAP